jgi:hypothetical protein
LSDSDANGGTALMMVAGNGHVEVLLGFGRIVALYCRSTTSYQIR